MRKTTEALSGQLGRAICVNRTDDNTPQSELNDKEVFVRRKDRFDRYVLAEPVSENITTRLSTEQEAAPLTPLAIRARPSTGFWARRK